MSLAKSIFCTGIALFSIGLTTRAAEIALVPIGADGAHNIVGNEIILQGAGQRVVLEIRLSGWSPSLLRAWQASLDSAGYTSGIQGELAAASVACGTNNDCAAALGGTCSLTGTPCFASTDCAFPQFGEICDGPKCTYPPGVGGSCEPAYIDALRADYVFAATSNLPAMDLSTADFRWASAATGAPVSDPGTATYAGTLVLDVPAGALGTFTVGFMPVPESLLQDSNNDLIAPLTITPALISIACATAADCDDGNACTDDACNAGQCSATPNYNQTTQCCNPTDGSLTAIDDGNECTTGSCDAGTGAVTQTPRAQGTTCGNSATGACDAQDTCDAFGACIDRSAAAGSACGDPTATECDGADTCDGAGACQTNLQPSGAACGNATITDCDRADTCDGAGACRANIEPAGTTCGDPSDTECDNPDTCDGAGTCQANVTVAGLPCGNQVGNQCDNPDTCDGAGACQPNFVAADTACGNPGSSECDARDTCNGSGTCQANHVADNTACTDDGNACRDDVCLAGVCSHPLKPAGAACGNPTDTECNGADTCDGAGTCLPNLVAGGSPCGDPSVTACTNADTCDTLGNCRSNNAPNGIDCDDGSFCNAGATCLAGLCGGGSALDCSDGLVCTDDICNETLQQCDHDLIPGHCLINGACYLEAEVNPSNDCQICDSFSSPTAWTALAEGTACDDGDACTGTGQPGIGFDACDAAGSCVGSVDPDCNDDCINAVQVFDGSNVGNNANRGPDDDEAICQFDSNNDVWYFYVASCDGPVKIDTVGSQFVPSNDTVLTVYDACGGNELACDDDSGPGLLSLATFTATAGVSYDIRVAGFMDSAGDIVLNIATQTNCVIDGACVAEGTINPANECEACIPWLSSIGWSSRPAGSICGDPTKTDCNSPDSCDGAGTCEQNFKPNQTTCGDDGNDCTRDVCISGACTHPAASEGTACGDQTATECDNADTCDGAGACLPNFAPTGLLCGDSSTSECDNADVCDGAGACSPNHQPDGLGCGDDGAECTFDACESGLCAHPPRPSGTACGDSGDTECDNPDTCDGEGACLLNHESAGFACGDPTDTDCDNPDTCNGDGACLVNYEAVNFACGDPTDTDCDNPDTCNGTGGCLDNLEISGFPCGDPSNTQCDHPDTCDGGGVCEPNYVAAGNACGDPADTSCDNPDTCDGGGACAINHEADGTVCPDDGNDCSEDLCAAGLCDHPLKPEGTLCGDGTDTECDNPDTCNVIGVCQFNFEPEGLACGDPSDDQCDHPDTCDGSGLCDNRFEAQGTACDDGDICTTDDACLAGVCASVPASDTPTLAPRGPRHFTVTPGPIDSTAQVALRVTAPAWPCLNKYLSPSGSLVNNPVFLLPSAWGTVIASSQDIVPSTTYHVQAECGSLTTAPGVVTTTRWGDIVGDFNTGSGQWTPPNGDVDISDIVAAVEAFEGQPTAPSTGTVDLWPCVPDGIIDIVDIVQVVDAFEGTPYPCPGPCSP